MSITTSAPVLGIIGTPYTIATSAAISTITTSDVSVCTAVRVDAQHYTIAFFKAGTCDLDVLAANAGTVTQSITVGVRITSTPAETQAVGSAYTVVADSAGATFTVAPASTAGTCTVNAATGVVTFLAAGTCQIQATSNNRISMAQSITVVVVPLTFTSGAGTAPAVVGESISVTTSASATVTSTTPTICTVTRVDATTSTVQLLASGDCALSATNTNGGSATQTFKVAANSGGSSSSSSSTGVSGASGSRGDLSLWTLGALQVLALVSAAVLRQM